MTMNLLSIVPAPYRVLAIIALVISSGIYGWIMGSDHQLTKQKIIDQNVAVKILEKKVVQHEITERVVTKYVDRIQIVKQKGDTLIQRIPTYITRNDDANCTIPDSFRVLWNQANRGDDGETTGTTDESTDDDEPP